MRRYVSYLKSVACLWLATPTRRTHFFTADSTISAGVVLALFLCHPLWAQNARYELPAEQRTGTIQQIFVVSHSHLDIGFTKPPDEVARDYKDNIDSAMRLAREHPDFRWTIESAWMLEEWLRRTDDDALVTELGQLIREGRIALGVAFANMHSGLMAAEESNRLIYLGHKFRRRFGIEAPVAFQNDVPGFTWAYPRILAGGGVKYLVTGLNLFIGGGNNLGVAKNPFYWVGPDGSRVLTWFTYDSYVEGYRWKLSGRFTLSELEAMVPRRLAWLERNGYPYDTYFLMASPGDNADPRGAFPILERIREWNRRHPQLPMKMCTAEEFFHYLIQKYGDDFPTASGDSAGHWEIVKLRAPEAAAKMRQTANTLPAAETAATIASLLTGSAFPLFDFSQAWQALLTFHEHTADAGAGWPGYFSRWETDWNNVAHYAAAISGFSNTEQQFNKALIRMGKPAVPQAGKSTVMVYNGLSWTRSGPVIVERLPNELREGPLAVVDLATGEKLPSQGVPGTHRQILFFARDVPSIGYRLYAVEKVDRPVTPTLKEFPLKVAWNDAGWTSSIFDQKAQREMLQSKSDRPFGGLFVSRDRDEFRLEGSGPAEVQTEDGPVVRRIEIARKGSPLPLSVITLYREAAYADLRFNVDLSVLGNDPSQQQRYAIALPLRNEQPMFVDGAGFVLRVPRDLLPGGIAPQFMPVHFTHLQQAATWGVTLANKDSFSLRPELLFLVASEGPTAKTHEEGVQRLFRTEPRASPVQSFHFRIAVQPENPWEWKQFGAELNLPLRAVTLNGTQIPPLRGFFELNQPAVQLLAFKPAEHRQGWYAIRLQEIAGTGAKGVKLVTPFRIAEAVLANTVEEPTTLRFDLSNFSLEPWKTLTILARVNGHIQVSP